MQKYKSYSNWRRKFRIAANISINFHLYLHTLRHNRRKYRGYIKKIRCLMHCYKKTCLPHPRAINIPLVEGREEYKPAEALTGNAECVSRQ